MRFVFRNTGNFLCVLNNGRYISHILCVIIRCTLFLYCPAWRVAEWRVVPHDVSRYALTAGHSCGKRYSYLGHSSHYNMAAKDSYAHGIYTFLIKFIHSMFVPFYELYLMNCMYFHLHFENLSISFILLKSLVSTF